MKAGIVRYLENINNNIVMEICIYIYMFPRGWDRRIERRRKEKSGGFEFERNSPIFLQRGWPSGRIRSTHRSGGKNVAGRGCSRTRGRGRSLKISIRDFHSNERGERGSRRTAKRLSISCKSTGHRWKRRANTSARVPCLLLKCLHRPLACRNAPDIADFSSTAAEETLDYSPKFLSPNVFFSFFRPTISFLELMKNRRLPFFSAFFFSRRISINWDLESNVSSVLCDLFFVTLENLETWLCKYSRRSKKSLEIR